jgi:hypothetical protein
MRPVMSYIRVSTGKQGKSGLGIEAQREAIARFAAAEGLDVLTEFVEVESGKGSDALDRGRGSPKRWQRQKRPRHLWWWRSFAAYPGMSRLFQD